ncbi:sigma-70 family RNA polymerase sigma factor [Amycolatopsis sp. NPDC001319]|uniref:sigma-70 family RNA polymerase sigma factor n=1 Tax=unclassified Amycolatopsis TaxID=2618356 RepID=UPI0036B8EF60
MTWYTLPVSVKRQEDLDDTEVQTLVLSAQTGDSQAFGELYRLYYRRLLLWMRSNAPDASYAEDLVQELFAWLLTEIVEYQPREGGCFRAWLYGQAKIVMRRHLWEQGGQQRAAEVEADRILRGQDEHECEIELSPEVAAALDSLSPVRRRDVELHHLEGLPYETVGAVTGRRADTAKTSCVLGVRQLRPRLAELAPTRRRQPPEGATVFTLKEAAARFGVPYRTLWGASREHRFPTYWIGRQLFVTADDLAAYLTSAQPGRRATANAAVPAPRDGSATLPDRTCAA